jgi:hypothetical protein
MKPLLAAACAAGLALAARADVRLDRSTRWELLRPGAPAERSSRRETAWIGDGRLRMEDRVSREAWIAREDTKTLLRIDHAAGTYSETTFEEAAAARAAVAADLRTALARIEGSGEEPPLRALLEAFAPDPAPAKVEARGDGPAVAGRATKRVELVAGRVVATLNLAASSDGGNLIRPLAAAGLFPAPWAGALGAEKGLPLSGEWTLVFPEAAVKEMFEVTALEVRDAPTGTWDPPQGFRKVSAPSPVPASKAGEAPPGGHEGEGPDEPEEKAEGEEAGTGK